MRMEFGRFKGGVGAALCGVVEVCLAFADLGVEEKGRAGE